MTDGVATPNQALIERFVALVMFVVERPQDGLEQRDAARGVVEAAKAGPVTFTLQEGLLLADGAPVEAPMLAQRFGAYGLEELGITANASQADVLELARLLAATPGAGDQPSRFAGRAAVLDAKALPRRLVQRAEPTAATSPAAAPVAEPAPERRPTPRATTAVRTPSISMAAVAPPEPRPEPRDAPVRLARALEIPTPSTPLLAAAIDAFDLMTDARQLNAALDQLVALCDLAFRQGRHDDLIEGIAALIGIEFAQIERDSADERRQAFNHAIRRLARPVMLRQLAVLRHARAADAVACERLQQALYRFGIDAAEAVIDECQSATSVASRAACVEALRGLPRAHEALKVLASDANELVVRQAIAILADLRDAASEELLLTRLDHPDPRTRREAVAALARFDGDRAFDAVSGALLDESAQVRLRAVTALGARREARVLPLLEPLLRREPEREVIYAAVHAVGRLGSPEAVQALIPVAQGQGTGPHKDSAGLRIQACIALVGLRTPQAMAAVQVLRDDRDREVRQASVRLVAHARRRPTTTQMAVVPE